MSKHRLVRAYAVAFALAEFASIWTVGHGALPEDAVEIALLHVRRSA